VLSLSLDLKVDVHRKNSSESSEEVATLRPVVEKVSVHRAEQCTQADHEHYRTKLQGNPSFPMLLHYTDEERIIHKSFKLLLSTRMSKHFLIVARWEGSQNTTLMIYSQTSVHEHLVS